MRYSKNSKTLPKANPVDEPFPKCATRPPILREMTQNIKASRDLKIFHDGMAVKMATVNGEDFLNTFSVSNSPMVMKMKDIEGRFLFISPVELTPEVIARTLENHLTGLDALRARRQAWAEYIFRKFFRRSRIARNALSDALQNRRGAMKLADYEKLGIIETLDGKSYALVPTSHIPLRWAEYSPEFDLFLEKW